MKKHTISILLLTLLFSINISAQRIIREKQTETAINATAEEKTTDIKEIMKVVAEETEITEEEIETTGEEKEETSVAPTAQATPYVRPTSKERFHRYASDAFGVPAVIGSGIGAIFGQISNDPPEWERTAKGFGKRFASNYGEGAIRNTVSYGLSEAFKLDNRFEKSGKKNVGARIKYVFIFPVTRRARKTAIAFPIFHILPAHIREASPPPKFGIRTVTATKTVCAKARSRSAHASALIFYENFCFRNNKSKLTDLKD